MLRTLFAAVAALTLIAASPALACDDCKDCPHHKDKVAQADKKDGDAKKDTKVGCQCAGEAKNCKCAAACKCPTCHDSKDKKEETKKT